MRTRIATLTAAAATVCLAPSAAAHVTVDPDEAPAGSFYRFAIRVPTERSVATTRITTRLPEGIFFVSFERKAGWKRTVTMERLAQPVEMFGEEITERISSVTWSGGRIGPGEFEEFGVSGALPEREGEELVFPSLQTYADGEIVRWIGPADADEPAPRVRLTAPEPDEGTEEGASEPGSEAGDDAEEASAPPSSGRGDGNGRANLALGLGIAGLVAALVALVVSLLRPRRGTA